MNLLPENRGLNASTMRCVSLGLCFLSISGVTAFLPNPASVGSAVSQVMPTQHSSFHTLGQSFSSDEEVLSTADVDADEDAEQRLGDEYENGTSNGIGGEEFAVGDGPDRWDGLLASTGLQGKLKHVTDLPDERKVSTFDVFCNRELKMENLKAIGFDMDYTLARYQQPAFDKLAFDGAKEKLVAKLG